MAINNFETAVITVICPECNHKKGCYNLCDMQYENYCEEKSDDMMGDCVVHDFADTTICCNCKNEFDIKIAISEYPVGYCECVCECENIDEKSCNIEFTI